jgi:hypothetical protein
MPSPPSIERCQKRVSGAQTDSNGNPRPRDIPEPLSCSKRHIYAYSCTPIHSRYPTCHRNSAGAIGAEGWFILLHTLTLPSCPAASLEV